MCMDWSACFIRASMNYYFPPHPLEPWQSYALLGLDYFIFDMDTVRLVWETIWLSFLKEQTYLYINHS